MEKGSTSNTIPLHIALIPDGNRRWAKAHNLPTSKGHERAFENFIKLAKHTRNLGIKYFTVWGFSTENWKRSKDEVTHLMDLVLSRFDEMAKDIIQEEVRFRHLGRKNKLPKKLVEKFISLEEETKNFSRYYFNLAFDYGGREEIIHAIKRILKDKVEISNVTEELINNYLYTKNIPDPDLIIRTSGEQRLSGFLPWQGVYAEFYFAKVHFPDFNNDELKKAINAFSLRKRRFGGD